MSGLALVAHELGATVTGSDQSDGPYLGRLRQRGIDVTIGHHSDAVPEDAQLVISSAIPVDNPERVRGRERGLRENGRGQLLAEFASTRRCIAVAGTHGKTTTAAMILHALRGAGERADYVIGGDLLATGTNAEWTGEGWFVIETDESDRSLLSLAPEIGALTNVELDHLETFGALHEVEEVFQEFLEQCERAVVWNRPDVAKLGNATTLTFDAVDVSLSAVGSRSVWRGHEMVLSVPGEHNARNAAAALEVCALVGVDPAAAAVALKDFPGVARRFEFVGKTVLGATVYDDYAHHPSEVAATLAAARTFDPEKLVVVFRPWGLDRARVMARAFGEALANADVVAVLDVGGGYVEGGPGAARAVQLIVDAAVDAAPHRQTAWVADLDGLDRYLRSSWGPRTMCVTLGCGDVAQWLVGSRAAQPPHAGTGVEIEHV